MTTTTQITVYETSEVNCNDEVLTETLSRLLTPLARLCLSRGITFAPIEELLKKAFVQEAGALQPEAPLHGMVSRISTATGINRREVTRLTKQKHTVRTTKPPLAAELFARWTTNPALQDQSGTPAVLERQGPAPSFEALAHSITRDIHPRSMLDELIRLGLAHHDEQLDRVSLVRTEFVPGNDSEQMLRFVGENIGDHLEAAITNVLGTGDKHLEQAVFADELSAESIKALRPLIMHQWKALSDALVPAITEMIEADQLAGRRQDKRLRIGVYTFTETPLVSASDPALLSGCKPTAKDKSK